MCVGDVTCVCVSCVIMQASQTFGLKVFAEAIARLEV